MQPESAGRRAKDFNGFTHMRVAGGLGNYVQVRERCGCAWCMWPGPGGGMSSTHAADWELTP